MEYGSGPLRSLNTPLQVHPSPCSGTSHGCPRLHLHSFSWLLHACLSLAASPSYYLPVHLALRLSTDRIRNIRLLFKTTGMVEGSCSWNRSSVRVHFFSYGLVNFWNLPFPTLLWVGGGLIGITSVLLKPKVFFSCAFENININRFLDEFMYFSRSEITLNNQGNGFLRSSRMRIHNFAWSRTFSSATCQWSSQYLVQQKHFCHIYPTTAGFDLLHLHCD